MPSLLEYLDSACGGRWSRVQLFQRRSCRSRRRPATPPQQWTHNTPPAPLPPVPPAHLRNDGLATAECARDGAGATQHTGEERVQHALPRQQRRVGKHLLGHGARRAHRPQLQHAILLHGCGREGGGEKGGGRGSLWGCANQLRGVPVHLALNALSSTSHNNQLGWGLSQHQAQPTH